MESIIVVQQQKPDASVGCVDCVVDTSLFSFSRGPEGPEQADRQAERGRVSVLLVLMDMSSEKHLPV